MTNDRNDRRDRDAHGDRRSTRAMDRDEWRHEERTRVRWTPRPGSRIALLMAAALIVLAGYFMLAPVFMETANGWFPCGSVLSGPEDEFTANTCRSATDGNRAKALAAAALAVVVAGGGLLSFGGDRTTETRRQPRAVEDDLDLRPRPNERAGRRQRGPGRDGSSSRQPAEQRPPRDHERDGWTDDGWR